MPCLKVAATTHAADELWDRLPPATDEKQADSWGPSIEPSLKVHPAALQIFIGVTIVDFIQFREIRGHR
jgi:hypothetical protein